MNLRQVDDEQMDQLEVRKMATSFEGYSTGGGGGINFHVIVRQTCSKG